MNEPPPLPASSSPPPLPESSPVLKADKPFWKRWWFWIVAYIVLVALTKSDTDKPTMDGTVNQTTAEAQTGKSGSSKANGTYDVAEEFTLGDFKYRIAGVQTQRILGNQFIKETASDGATFLVVSYTIENCSKESSVVLSDDFSVVDAKGRTFKPSSDANTALMATEENKDFILSELQPGIPRRMKTAFEIPLSNTNEEMTLVIPKKGFFSSGEAKVRIRP